MQEVVKPGQYFDTSIILFSLPLVQRTLVSCYLREEDATQ